MKILIIGEEIHLDEAKTKLASHSLSLFGDHREAERFVGRHDLVFDFLIDEDPSLLQAYHEDSVPVFLNTTKMTLQEILVAQDRSLKGTVFGFNGLPTFFNRNVMEVCLRRREDEAELQKICNQLESDYLIVDDRVGMVTPRVVCMIINEAFFTVQEGTSTKEDIDQAMKLGTNYPFGPFEWSERIGIHHVYELLDALFEDTRDERYKICPLLKKAYLESLMP